MIKTNKIPQYQVIFVRNVGLFYRWRDRFLESAQKRLLNEGGKDEGEALRAEIEKLQKIIGRQTIAIEALKKTQDLISGKP